MIPVVSRRGPIVLAHRGGGAEAPENTMAAFEHARSLGVRHIETDAHLTADGRVVLSHDDAVDRCFDGTGLIAQLDWREISRLRHREAPGEKMPLLAEVLEAFPDMYFNIDAKVPLIAVIEEHRAASRTLVASFKESRLRAVRTRGSIPTSLGTEAVVRLVGAAKTATDPSRWCVPGPSQGVVAAQVPAGLGPLRVVDRRFVAAAHPGARRARVDDRHRRRGPGTAGLRHRRHRHREAHDGARPPGFARAVGGAPGSRVSGPGRPSSSRGCRAGRFWRARRGSSHAVWSGQWSGCSAMMRCSQRGAAPVGGVRAVIGVGVCGAVVGCGRSLG